ncbi:MAG: glycosyltransferase family 2 protein [Pirellulales bacterium]
MIGPFFNASRHVDSWLDGLSAQTYSNFKLYLVDDHSTDDTLERIQARLGGLAVLAEMLALPANSGPAAARNKAIRTALHEAAEIILLLDSDCRVEPDWLERHASFHEAHPEVAIVGGGMQGKSETAVGKADGFCSWFTAVPFSRARVPRMHLCTTNMSIRASVFERIGFFDERLATGEDVAFCRKARQAGFRLWLQPDIVALHLDRGTLGDAMLHHYRWGLHSYALALQEQGGYYGVLKRLRSRWLVMALVPPIAVANVLLVLIQYSFHAPCVWLYLPWICRLKWANAVGVYRGYVSPKLCLRKQISSSENLSAERALGGSL